MYAVIQTGGKQYRVEPGQTLSVEKLPGENGDPVQFDDVLLVSDEDKLEIGRPMVEGASVKAEIVEQGKDQTHETRLSHALFALVEVGEPKEDG